MREDEYYLPPCMDMTGNAVERPTIFAANAYYLFCVIGIIISSVAFAVVAGLVQPSQMKLSYYLISSICEISVFALLPILYTMKNPSVIHAFRLNTPAASMVALGALLAVLCFFLSNYVGTLWMVFIENIGGSLEENSLLSPTSIQDLTMLIIVAGLLPGICEEIMFRGMVLGAWEARGGKKALIVTSFLFAALHASVLGFPSQLIAAFILGMLALCSGSIYPGMVFHILYNSLLMIASFFSGSSGGTYASPTLYESIGGMAGVLQLVMLMAFFGALVFGVLAAVYRVGAKRRNIYVARQVDSRSRVREVIVLAAALVTVALLFLLDVASVFGLPV